MPTPIRDPGATAPTRFPRIAAVLCLLILTACGGDEATEPALSRDEFVEVIVDLREAERAVAEEDSAAELFAARKAEILERHGTSEEEIREYVRASTGDLQGMADTWEEISGRLGRAADPDSTGMDPPRPLP